MNELEPSIFLVNVANPVGGVPPVGVRVATDVFEQMFGLTTHAEIVNVVV